jgi:Domain of unknown function (DUF4337)
LPVEIEVPTEHLHEAVHEAHHQSNHGSGHGHGHGDRFTLGVALSSAMLAVLAALAALFAGHNANEAMIERVEASDHWSYYQAKGIKANVLRSKLELLGALEKPVRPEDEAKLKDYAKDQAEIEGSAREKEHASEMHLEQHNILARSVTFFQVAIALGAISVLTRRRALWWGSLAVGLAGTAFMVMGMRPVESHEPHKVELPQQHAPAPAHAPAPEHANAEGH